MRIPPGTKFALLGVLGAVTFFVTSSLIASARRRAGDGREARADRRHQTSTQELPAGATPVGASQPGGRWLATAAMTSHSVLVKGRTVQVAAKAHVRDSRPGMTYAWGVRVLDFRDDSVVVWEKLYEDESFGFPDKVVDQTPTFVDELPLNINPGPYVLETSLYMVPPTRGVADLRDADWASYLRGPSGRSDVILGP